MSSKDMLGSPGEDLGLVHDFVTKLRHGGSDFRERAKKFLRSTIFTLTLGDGGTKEELLALYNWVGDVARAFVESDQFRFSTVREDVDLEFVDGTDFDHDPSWKEVLAEFARRGLEEPTEEDALRYGATCPKGKDKRAVVFLHKKNLWRGPGGRLGFLVFSWWGSRRRLGCGWFAPSWRRPGCRFAGRRPRNSLHFSSRLGGSEFFINCPFHPPSILPTSSIFSDSATYFFVSSDFDSHKIISRSFSTSTFRVATRTNGSFSSRARNAAAEIISSTSMNRVSIFPPTVYW